MILQVGKIRLKLILLKNMARGIVEIENTPSLDYDRMVCLTN